ncbi:hypothetical protein CGERO_02370 [Corynebacterium gerontici]|uniref:Uncharacterized protein n=2 Tax=Corynebacterium gerontici TaxID=2079234 RepID=A0A3G6J1G4_9CORY|nr:hypothetical protein CGERO_02370 [Corynebacterium gerontici]
MHFSPLCPGENRYEGMRNLPGVVVNSRLAYTQKKTGDDYAFTKSTQLSMTSGTRSFDSQKVSHILDGEFDSVEAIDRLSEKIKQTSSATIERDGSGIVEDHVRTDPAVLDGLQQPRQANLHYLRRRHPHEGNQVHELMKWKQSHRDWQQLSSPVRMSVDQDLKGQQNASLSYSRYGNFSETRAGKGSPRGS